MAVIEMSFCVPKYCYNIQKRLSRNNVFLELSDIFLIEKSKLNLSDRKWIVMMAWNGGRK